MPAGEVFFPSVFVFRHTSFILQQQCHIVKIFVTF